MLLLQCTDLLILLHKSPWKKNSPPLPLIFLLHWISASLLRHKKQDQNMAKHQIGPDLCAAVILYTWVCVSYFPLTELLGIKAVPVPREMKSSMPRQTAIWDETFQCLISLKSRFLWCFHHPSVHINKAWSYTKSSWEHFLNFLKVYIIFYLVPWQVSQTCAPLNWTTDSGW